MLNKNFAGFAFVYLTIAPAALASPIGLKLAVNMAPSPMVDGYALYRHDLSVLVGDWYAEATSPAIYDPFAKWFKESGYRCKCVHNSFQAVEDYRLNVTRSCNLHKDGNGLVGQATVTGHFNLFTYTTELYGFWYKEEEAYYTTVGNPDLKHELITKDDYYKNGAFYYPVPPKDNSTQSAGYIEFTSHEDKMYSALYAHEHLDDRTLQEVIKELRDYDIEVTKIDRGTCN